MTAKIELKEKIFEQLNQIISKRIDTANSAMKAAVESRNNETKSSVGDKYETGRAMMQLEEEKNRVQLSKARELKTELSLVPINKIYSEAGLGSLVLTNKGNYFLSVGLGKIILDDIIYYSISMASPVGKLFYGKRIGERISFNGFEYEIVDLF